MYLNGITGRKWRWIGHWIHREGGTLRGLEGGAVPKRPGGGRSRKKPWKWGRHGARLKKSLLAGSGGSVSQMSYAREAATGIGQMLECAAEVFCSRL
jgi:hypothetical protein